MTSGSTSGSTRSIGYLSASIEWARRIGRPGCVAGVVAVAGRRLLLLHGQGQHRLPRRDLARHAARLRRQGRQGGKPGPLGELNLPSEVVSSEFLTMEGKKFSSSRSVVIYVRDFLARYDVDALRYYVAVAGPENQDTDFTWSEFVRRNNDELVANWGNLVNRTISFAARNIGEIPAAGELTEADQALLAGSRAAFATVGDALGRVPVQGGDHRGHAHAGRGQQVPVRPGAVEAARVRPGPDAHDLPRGAAAGGRRQDAADAVPAPVIAEGARDARRHRDVVGHAADRRGRRGWRADLPGDHRGLPDARRAGHRRRSSRARRLCRRYRCSPSWTRPSSTRNWPGWRASDRTGRFPATGSARARASADRRPRRPSRCRHRRSTATAIST